jgi:hypothetical protein
MRKETLAILMMIGTCFAGSADVNIVEGPWVFSGYRNVVKHPKFMEIPSTDINKEIWATLDRNAQIAQLDSIIAQNIGIDTEVKMSPEELRRAELSQEPLPIMTGDVLPDWLSNNIENNDRQLDAIYSIMVEKPQYIQYAYWDLPVPPKLPEEDYSFNGYLKRLNLPNVDVTDAKLGDGGSIGRVNWLHTFNTGLQLSQAYVSDNWYQGGNSYLAFLFNFLWDVQLNQVYHPNTMFQSTLSYKFSINSSPEDQYHKYSISQDLFQYNLKAGIKAAHHWYYSITTQFKTQFFKSYPSNSMSRSASLLSPGELNVGLGMTYNKETDNKKFKISASIAPLSYNLKTCIDKEIDHSQFGIKDDRNFVNEIGSNAEVNINWTIWNNITYTSRLFLFSDYTSFQGDWENTFDFKFNKYFSTQLYFHLRYDSEADSSIAPNWKKWMLKEILSVGFSYAFSTK